MPPELIDALAGEAAEDADLVIIEASMGLFDGVYGTPGRTGAAADLAARLGLPVVLVLDISGQSQSAAAVVRGFATHDPAVRIAGVVLNKAASPRHRTQAGEAIAALGIPLLGSLPREAAMTLPERHLGLVQAQEHPALAAHLATPRGFRRGACRSRCADGDRRADGGGCRPTGRGAAAGAADRAGAGCRLQLHL